MRRIGIDVGGTNTDAILIDDGRVVRAVKAPTSEDVTAGILQALAQLRAVPEGQGDVDAVMIGTTHFINAVVQRRQLTPVGALRIGEPMSGTLPPFCDWPPDLAAIAKGAMASVEGGFEYDGRPIMPLDEAAIRQTARQMGDQGLRAVAIAAIFSPIDDGHERRAAEIVAEEIPEAAITLSSDLGRIGLLERENAALLNAVGAAIAQVSGEVDQIFRDLSRTEAIAAARELAAERAVAAGASAATLKTIETEDMPLSYLPGNSLRVRVRMVGDVAVDGQ